MRWVLSGQTSRLPGQRRQGAYHDHRRREHSGPEDDGIPCSLLVAQRRYAFTLLRAAWGGTRSAACLPSLSVKATARENFPFRAPRLKVPSPQNCPLTTRSKRVTLPAFVSTKPSSSAW